MPPGIIEEELFPDRVKEYPALFDKTVKGYKEKDVLYNFSVSKSISHQLYKNKYIFFFKIFAHIFSGKIHQLW